MNKRQAKKTFKKKYGENPKYYTTIINVSVEKFIQSIYDVGVRMSEMLRQTIKTIQTTPEEEFEAKMAEMANSGNLRAVAIARAIRQHVQTEEGKENGDKTIL